MPLERSLRQAATYDADKDISFYKNGDGIVLYTDGIPEAENPKGEMDGLERLCQVVSHAWNAPADAPCIRLSLRT